MKLIPSTSFARMAMLFAALISPQTGRAGLWKTEAQLTAEYGEPVEIRRELSHSLRTRRFTYQVNDLKLEVQFLDGISQSVFYEHNNASKPFTSEEIDWLLKVNSDGKAWSRNKEEGWELGDPPVATAHMRSFDASRFSEDGKEILEKRHFIGFDTVAFEDVGRFSELYQLLQFGWQSIPLRWLRSGGEKRFQGVLEFIDEKDESRVAVIRDGTNVLEIPWARRGYCLVRANTEPGHALAITLRREDPVDLDAPIVFVSDRVHKSHSDRVIDSEFFSLVRIQQGSEILYDESVCEVHKTPMQRQRVTVGYGLYVAPTKADAICDQKYPHHSDWIRGGCLVGDVTSAFHYVCRECVAATASYKREHPEETSPSNDE